MVNQYETTLIVTPVLTDTELKELTSGYVKFLKSKGAEIIHEDHWGLKQLAYPIKNKTTGFYFLVEFKVDTQVINEFEVNLKRDESVMRFLTVKLDKYAVKYNEDKRNGLIGRKKKDSKETTEEEA